MFYGDECTRMYNIGKYTWYTFVRLCRQLAKYAHTAIGILDIVS